VIAATVMSSYITMAQNLTMPPGVSAAHLGFKILGDIEVNLSMIK
jgi:hypothetical protein